MENDKPTVKRISRIKKGIERTINTAKYESIVIHSFLEEEIEWSSLEERQQKSRNWDKFLVDDFKKTHDYVLEELGLGEKSAYFKNALDSGKLEPSKDELKFLDTLD